MKSVYSVHLLNCFLYQSGTGIVAFGKADGNLQKAPYHGQAEYSGNKAVFDFQGNVLKGSLSSRTATRLVREWADLHLSELEEDWKLARESKTIKKIVSSQATDRG